MKFFKCTAPFGPEVLVEILEHGIDDAGIVVDYEASSFKGELLFTYLKNVGIPADIIFNTVAGLEEAVTAYMSTDVCIRIPSLINEVMKILAGIMNLTEAHFKFSPDFNEKNKHIIKRWLDIIDSLPVYAQYTAVDEKIKAGAEKYVRIEYGGNAAVNIANCLLHEFLPLLIDTDDRTQRFFIPRFFERDIYYVKNLFHSWAN